MSVTPPKSTMETADLPVVDDPSTLRVVVGLGNPGARYAGTRHNLGFMVVDELARRRDLRLDRELCGAHLAVEGELVLMAPQTFMNRSGFATRCLTERWRLAPEQFLIVYDELHLPLGRLRVRGKGSPAGHRGLESILENMGTAAVPRLRMGVGQDAGSMSEGADLVSFVLSGFHEDEASTVTTMVERAADASLAWAEHGLESTMQVFNG